jgi:hypothetical protein
MMTPKMSLRRRNILSEHAHLIESLYKKEVGVDVNIGGIASRKWDDSISTSMN